MYTHTEAHKSSSENRSDEGLLLTVSSSQPAIAKNSHSVKGGYISQHSRYMVAMAGAGERSDDQRESLILDMSRKVCTFIYGIMGLLFPSILCKIAFSPSLFARILLEQFVLSNDLLPPTMCK